MSDTKQSIAFIGTGIMGGPMARHLLEAGYPVAVFNRSPSKCGALVAAGARLAASAAEAAAQADVVITMVGYPEDVEELYLARGGLLEASRPGAYLIDMTTSSPELARDIAEVAEVSGRHAFDAPVTGGQQGAEAGTLTVFCGAPECDVAPVRPVLEAMASRVLAFGGPGKGQMAKLANQVALAGCMVGLAEGLAFAKEGGLDLEQTLDALAGGMAGSTVLDQLGPKMLAGDFAPGFMVAHYVKDLGLALQTAEEEELTLPGVETANQLYGMLDAIGGSRMGTQALGLVYADEASCAACGLDWTLLSQDDDEEGEGHGGECGCGCHDHGCGGGAGRGLLDEHENDFEGALAGDFDEDGDDEEDL